MPTLLATRNQGKLKEVKEILGDRLGELVTLDAFPSIGELPEDFDTFEANARQKAWTAAEQSGCMSLSDDSGLIVDALGGAPGVYSAMYAGKHGDHAANRKKLIEAMRDVPQEKRTARFTCILVLADPATHTELLVQGFCEGLITFEERGSKGFGYDPLFLVPQFGLTMAEISAEQKNAVSHRGNAFQLLLAKLSDKAAWQKRQ
jgi:XTP/dITP diphosphohydrolase